MSDTSERRRLVVRPVTPLTPAMENARTGLSAERLEDEKACSEAITNALQQYQCSLTPAVHAVQNNYELIAVSMIATSIAEGLTEAEQAQDEQDCMNYIDECFKLYNCAFIGMMTATGIPGTFGPLVVVGAV